MSALNQLPLVLEAILLTADKPLSLDRLEKYFAPEEGVSRAVIREGLGQLRLKCKDHSFELTETGAGYRLQTRADFQQWVARHYEEKPPKYSKALLETLALIAWRQPITRGEIEEVRGVSTNAHVIKTLLEREWIRVLGHKEVPGRPEMLGTTRLFLDYFNLRSLDDLPSLAEIKALDMTSLQLDLLQDLPSENTVGATEEG